MQKSSQIFGDFFQVKALEDMKTYFPKTFKKLNFFDCINLQIIARD